MTPTQQRKLAEEIANELFTSGSDTILLVRQVSYDGRRHKEYTERDLASVIAEVIRRNQPKRKRKGKK